MATEALEAPAEAVIEGEATNVVVHEPTLRETLAEGMREIAERDGATPRDRDEGGRFKGKPADPEAAPVLEAAAAAEPVTPVVAEPIAVDPAPQSMSADARAKWADVPAEVRADITKRDREVASMVGRQDNERTFGRAMSDVIQPYVEMMRAGNTHPIEVISRMMQTEHSLITGSAEVKARTFAQAAKLYGVDLDLAYSLRDEMPAAQAPAPAAPPIDIEARVNAAVEAREYQREIRDFAATHEHFEAVKPHVAALLENNLARDLTDAYDQAIHARPELRSTLIAAQVAKAAAQQSVSQRTAQARLAAVSLSGSSGSSRPTGSHETSLRDELRNGLREMTSAA